MRAPNRVRSYFQTCGIATSILATLIARTLAATLPPPPSPADKWLYPDVDTSPTYNYLDSVNASWTSNFVAPYLLLRCQHPDDPVHYAYPYNQSVLATGSALVPLDDGNAWLCHFEVSDLSTSGTTPPTFSSNDFSIVLNDGQKPVLWTDSQDGGGKASSSATLSPTTADPTTSGISSSRISTSSTTTSSVTTTPITLLLAASTPKNAPTLSSTTASPTIASASAIVATPTQPSTSPTPSSTTSGLSKSKKIAIIVGSTMGALLLLVMAIGIFFVLRTRRSGRNAVVYRSGPGYGYGSKEVPGSEAPRERWKGVDIPGGPMQGYF